ncbi:hypothetical protein [Chromobacterium haemolyticum]|uniref:hypothetical protein n=1 Tax=Chromobacterium haemolyticum TaxID=394935 RepID=UPI001317691E|nr:hypothetical protein [Chromobacterium haemolyticum]BBH13812.1 hypothetical protein CH06BL_30600 [Chromobacterium haemolyticum]
MEPIILGPAGEFKNIPDNENKNGNLVFSITSSLEHFIKVHQTTGDNDKKICHAHKESVNDTEGWKTDARLAGCHLTTTHVVMRDYQRGDMLYGTSDAITAVTDLIKLNRKEFSKFDYSYFRRNGLNGLLTGGEFGYNKNDESIPIYNEDLITPYTNAIALEKSKFNLNLPIYYGRPGKPSKEDDKLINQYPNGYDSRQSNSKTDPVISAFGRASKKGLLEPQQKFIQAFKFNPCKIFYLLDGINIAAVADKTGPTAESIVGSEIRFLFRLITQDKINFPYLHWVLNGKYTCAPWDGPTAQLWENYKPKSPSLTSQ